jgi:hypothetical protein
VSGKTVLYVAAISLAVVVAYERYAHNMPSARGHLRGVA